MRFHITSQPNSEDKFGALVELFSPPGNSDQWPVAWAPFGNQQARGMLIYQPCGSDVDPNRPKLFGQIFDPRPW